MSDIPTDLVEMKTLYGYLLSPKTYFFNTKTHEIHSGKRYKYAVKQTYTIFGDRLNIFLVNGSHNFSRFGDVVISFSCKDKPGDKSKTENFDYEILINDILKNPSDFLAPH